MTIVFTPENGYTLIDTNAEEWQLGRKLFEAQRLLSDLEPFGKTPVSQPTVGQYEKLREVAHWFCRLVAEVGNLRASYSNLADVVRGHAEYRYTDKDGWVWEVKRCPTNRRKEVTA